MKANELRIGNWVMAYNSPVQIESIDKDGGINYTSANDEWTVDYWFVYQIKEIDPIPLTPEILEKAGFSNPYNIGYHLYIDKENTEGFGINFDDEGWDIGQNHEMFKFHSELKHLHQLQNLYYALTGEELQIEL
jgi:hypothetical protein